MTLSIGVASAVTDGREASAHARASPRSAPRRRRTAGGNRVVAEGGEVDPAAIGNASLRVPSVDGALRLLRAGARDEVAQAVARARRALLPLLELLESRLQSGLPLARDSASSTTRAGADEWRAAAPAGRPQQVCPRASAALSRRRAGGTSSSTNTIIRGRRERKQ